MPFSTSGEPMRDIELDEAEMPESEDGYNGFLTIVDRLTGYTSTYLIRKSDTTGDMIRILETLCYREGFPDTISTDEGSRWRSKEFKSWCEERGIQLEEAVPHHHQRQGKVERTHGLLKRALRAGLRDEANIQKYYDPRIWSSILPAATTRRRARQQQQAFAPVLNFSHAGFRLNRLAANLQGNGGMLFCEDMVKVKDKNKFASF